MPDMDNQDKIINNPIIEDNPSTDNFSESKNSEKSKKSFSKNVSDIKNKIKILFENMIMNKARKKLQTDMLFESVSNANTIFKVERKIGDYLILIAGFFFLTSLIELILIISLFPLKEKVPYLVTFATSTQNFAIVQKADSKITANTALVRQLLGAYILNRESINRIDDQERFDIVREQSSNSVWQVFERIVAKENSIYTNTNLTRNVQIVNIATIKKGYANADVTITLYANGLLQSEKRYRIIISYKFEPIEIDFQSMPKNPTGFIVTGYFITEIATIKELDPKNQVKNPDTLPSKIKYKNIKNDEEIDKESNNNQNNIENDEILEDYQYNGEKSSQAEPYKDNSIPQNQDNKAKELDEQNQEHDNKYDSRDENEHIPSQNAASIQNQSQQPQSKNVQPPSQDDDVVSPFKQGEKE